MTRDTPGPGTTPGTGSGHLPLAGRPRLGRSPFGPAAPSIAAALLYGVAAVLWVIAGRALPGGRWLAIHLFTLGTLTNLILVFTDHFGRTLTAPLPNTSAGRCPSQTSASSWSWWDCRRTSAG